MYHLYAEKRIEVKKHTHAMSGDRSDNDRWFQTCTIISNYILSYCFPIHITVLIFFSIIQIRFSLVYETLCPVDHRIVHFLFVIGILEIIYGGIGVLLLVFTVLYESYLYLCRLFFLFFVIEEILLLILIFCFLIGNYLVLHVKDRVQYLDSFSPSTYCHSRLYQTALWTAILDDVLLVYLFTVFVLKHRQWFLQQIKTCRTTKSHEID